jgi:hypothetical protein
MVGSISEIFEAEPPRRPVGAIGWAWGVGGVNLVRQGQEVETRRRRRNGDDGPGPQMQDGQAIAPVSRYVDCLAIARQPQ